MNGCHILLSFLVANCLQQISCLESTVGFKSILKCREYQQANIEQPINTDAILYPGELPSKTYFQQTNETRHPFAVSLYNNQTKPVCGGVLISERFVLTATHCFYNYRGNNNIVGVATGHNAISANAKDLYKVVRSIKHPGYTVRPVYHDIGLLELEKPVRFAPDVRPACLQVSTHIADTEWYMNAWVLRNEIPRLETYTAQEALSNVCQKGYDDSKKTPYGIIGHLQLCVLEGKQETEYVGKARNAVYVHNKGLPGYTIVGIPSIGHSDLAVPQVYNRISYYIGWIESEVWPEVPKRGCNEFRFDS